MYKGLSSIVLTGPECSGKTTMAQLLSQHFDVPLIPEYARIYLEDRPSNYKQEDLVTIAEKQIELFQKETISNPQLLFLDTWMMVINIWSEYKYGSVPAKLIELKEMWKPDLYLLCYPDIPYEDDPLRENENERMKLYNWYEKRIVSENVPFCTIRGEINERSEKAIHFINEQLDFS